MKDMKKETKKIGAYLVEAKACDGEAITQTLAEQVLLEQAGQYKSLGRLMVERGCLSAIDLEKSLHRQYVDILSASDLFSTLPPELLSVIVTVAEDRVVPRGNLVCRQGDFGDTFWMVITGSVQVFNDIEDAGRVALSTLSAGDGFGEMALLTGEPRSASVETLEPSRFLVIAKNDFDRVVSENPILGGAVARILAERLKSATHNLGRASATEKAYQRFVSEHQAGPQLDLIGDSAVVRKLRNTIGEMAHQDGPLLLCGPAGTEKKIVGWQIHKIDKGPDAPFLVVDAKSVTMGGGSGYSDDPVQLELAQASTLFGHRRGALPFAAHDRLGLLQVGDTGTMVIENSEFLAHGVQQKLAEFIKTGLLQSLGSADTIRAKVRIVMASNAEPDVLQQEKLLSEDMGSLLAGRALSIPSLRRRKKDLRAMVEYLVDQFGAAAGKPIHEIPHETFEEIMAYDWPGNMDELEVVIRRGVSLSRNGVLAPEDLFIGRMPATGKYTFNLLQLSPVRRFFQSPAFPLVGQIVSGLFFLFILLFGFFGPTEPENNVSLVLTWGLWEPLVILSALLLGRVWCGVCPVGAVSSILSEKGLKKNVPAFLRKYGIFISGLGLALIFWSGEASHMIASPRATAMLLLAIISGAVIFGILYQRRIWCRHLCPLGRLVGVLATCSPLELRANYSICNNECKDHACYVGDRECASGCPMYEGPFALRTNINCILCGNCMKNCQNNSPRFNLRLPAFELWAVDHSERAVALFVPVLIGTQFFRGLADGGMLSSSLAGLNHSLYLLAVMGVLSAVVFAYVRIVGKVVFAHGQDSPTQKAGLLANALLVPAALFELGYHAERFLTLGGRFFSIAGRQLGVSGEIPEAVASLWGIISLQIFFIVIGAVAGVTVLKKIYIAREGREGRPLVRYPRWPILFPVMFFLWIIVAG